MHHEGPDVGGAGSLVIEDALDVACVALGRGEVGEGLAVGTVLEDEDVEGFGSSIRRGPHLHLEAVGVGARIPGLQVEDVGGAGGVACVQQRVESEAGARVSLHTQGGTRPRGLGEQLQGPQGGRCHSDTGHRCLHEGAHLGQLDGAQALDVAAPHLRAAREAEDGVGHRVAHLQAAGGALGVAGDSQHAGLHGGASADESRVEDGGHLLGSGLGDVAEVLLAEGDEDVPAVVDAHPERLPGSEGVGAGTARGDGSRGAGEDDVHCLGGVGGHLQALAVGQGEGGTQGAAHDGGRGPAARGEGRRSRRGRVRLGVGGVLVVDGAHRPEVAAALLEETHGGEGQVRVRREAAEGGLVVLEGGAQHGLADGASLRQAYGPHDGGGRRGNATDARLLLLHDDFRRQQLTTHEAPRFLRDTRADTSGAAEGGDDGGAAGACRFRATSPRRMAAATAATESAASGTSSSDTPVARVREEGRRRPPRPGRTLQAHSPRATQYDSWGRRKVTSLPRALVRVTLMGCLQRESPFRGASRRRPCRGRGAGPSPRRSRAPPSPR
ncbi:hypothetical protein STIAU_1410 [Stigmatella aurantiaca DW4/3-1]|uniref:Uncharacterized protein n=1 Tax=Stigmatella aurantiaca (strain DW4/3-1) TaxID=378806 RepID=Q090D4_STIAD|nr:hypothetical protein STIAU_1410 [Stigmatella aurantiaca DW4/3-1]